MQQPYLDQVHPIANLAQAMHMCDEKKRLSSFDGTSCPTSSFRLAQSGFFSEGSGSQTRCYSCRTFYSNWEMMDKPDVIHRRISPDCPHLTDGDGRNIAINADPRGGVPANRIHGVIEDYPTDTLDEQQLVAPRARHQRHVAGERQIIVPIRHTRIMGRANSFSIQQDTQPNSPSVVSSLDHQQDYCLEQLNRAEAIATCETGRQRIQNSPISIHTEYRCSVPITFMTAHVINEEHNRENPERLEMARLQDQLETPEIILGEVMRFSQVTEETRRIFPTLCLICEIRFADTLLLNCRHMICTECSNGVTRSRCPSCGNHITENIPVHMLPIDASD